MNPIVWTHGYWKERKGGRAKVWTGNRGADETYEITFREEYYGVTVPPPHYQASVKRKQPNGDVWSYFVEPHKRFKTLKAAQAACEKHRKETCLSMNTPASAGTQRKNSNPRREKIVNALRAGKPKDSSEASAKSASLNLEARLSRNTRGVSEKAEDTKLTYSEYQSIRRMLEGTPTTVAGAMMALGIPTGKAPMPEVEAVMADMGLCRCNHCAWWVEHGKLRDGFCQDCRF